MLCQVCFTHCERWYCTLWRYDAMWSITWVNELMCAVRCAFNNGVISESVFFLYVHCKSICLLRERIKLYDKEVGFKLQTVFQTGLVVWEGSANLLQGGILCQCYFSPVSPTHLNQQRSVCHVTLLISSSQFAQLCIC